MALPWRRPKQEETTPVIWIRGKCSNCSNSALCAKGVAAGKFAEDDLEIAGHPKPLLFCEACHAEGKAGVTLSSFPPEIDAYRKRGQPEDMPTFPEEYGISELRNVNYKYPFEPHTIYPSDHEMLKKMRNDEVPKRKWNDWLGDSAESAQAAVDKAAKQIHAKAGRPALDEDNELSWLSNVNYEELVKAGWRYSESVNREDRSHRDINFGIHGV